jgi:hypothetical protein
VKKGGEGVKKKFCVLVYDMIYTVVGLARENQDQGDIYMLPVEPIGIPITEVHRHPHSDTVESSVACKLG